MTGVSIRDLAVEMLNEYPTSGVSARWITIFNNRALYHLKINPWRLKREVLLMEKEGLVERFVPTASLFLGTDLRYRLKLSR